MDGLCLNIYLRWLTGNEINRLDMVKYKEDSEKDLILEVDLEYPQDLHDLHSDYPLAPEQMKVTKEMLSSYCESIREKFNTVKTTYKTLHFFR